MSLPPFLAEVASAGVAGTVLALVWAVIRRRLVGGPSPILAGGLLVLARFLWVDPGFDTWLPDAGSDRQWSRPEVLSEPQGPVAETPDLVAVPAGHPAPVTEWAWMAWSLGALVAASVLVGRGGWGALVRRRGSSLVGFEAGMRVRTGPGVTGARAARGAAVLVLALLVTACVSTGVFRSAAPESELVGTWATVDFVAQPEDFVPGVRSFRDPDFLEGLSWDGRGPWTMKVRGAWQPSPWTLTAREVVGDGVKGPWFVAHQGGKVYLAFSWLSGDVARGQAPHYYILEKTSATAASAPATSYPVDRTPPGPFVDDPSVAGLWKVVDFVASVDAFVPGSAPGAQGLYLRGLEFLPGGKVMISVDKGTFAHRWSQGYLGDTIDQVRSPYQVRRIGDRDYLFYTWISGDVVNRGQAPWYYVLTR